MLNLDTKNTLLLWQCAKNDWFCNPKNGVENSCYCITYNHCTTKEMERYCNSINSTVAHDINDEETELFLKMVKNISKTRSVKASPFQYSTSSYIWFQQCLPIWIPLFQQLVLHSTFKCL